MSRTRTVIHAVAAIIGLAALTLAGEAAADFDVKLRIKVDLPPGVKASDVEVHTGDPGHPSIYRLNEDGEVEARISGNNNNQIVSIEGPKGFASRWIWVGSNEKDVRDITFKADEFATLEAFYSPEKVFKRGTAAAAAGDAAGVKAAADELDQSAKANRRRAAEIVQALDDAAREAWSGLPPEFINDFLREFHAASTPEQKQRVVAKFRKSATVNAPDAVTTPEFRRGRDEFLRTTAKSFGGYGSAQDNIDQSEKARGYAGELRQIAVTPPGHGSLIQPGTVPKFPGETIPGVPGAPAEYAAVLKRDYWAQFGAGVAFFDATSVGYGSQRTGAAGTEGYIAETSSHSTGYRLAADGGAALGDRAEVVGHAAYRHADFEGNGFVPVGGATVATTYFNRAPNGSTGIDQGTNGANTSVHGNISKYEVDVAYRMNINTQLGWSEERPKLKAGIGIGFRRFEFSYMAEQTSPTFDGVHSKAWIDGTTNFIGPRIDSSIAFDVPAAVPFKIEIAGYVIPGYRWGDGRAKQRSLCDVCGADEQNLKIVVERNRSGFGLVAGVTGRVAIDLTDDLQLGFEGGYEFTNAVNSWKIPKGPFEAPADLATEPVKIGYVGVNLRLSF
jgi:hypothetical protein